MTTVREKCDTQERSKKYCRRSNGDSERAKYGSVTAKAEPHMAEQQLLNNRAMGSLGMASTANAIALSGSACDARKVCSRALWISWLNRPLRPLKTFSMVATAPTKPMAKRVSGGASGARSRHRVLVRTLQIRVDPIGQSARSSTGTTTSPELASAVGLQVSFHACATTLSQRCASLSTMRGSESATSITNSGHSPQLPCAHKIDGGRQAHGAIRITIPRPRAS